MALVIGLVCAILAWSKWGVDVGLMMLVAVVGIWAWRRTVVRNRGVAKFYRNAQGYPIRWQFESKVLSIDVDLAALEAHVRAPHAETESPEGKRFGPYAKEPLNVTVPATCLVLRGAPGFGPAGSSGLELVEAGHPPVGAGGSRRKARSAPAGQSNLTLYIYGRGAAQRASAGTPDCFRRGALVQTVHFPAALSPAAAEYLFKAWGEVDRHIVGMVAAAEPLVPPAGSREQPVPPRSSAIA